MVSYEVIISPKALAQLDSYIDYIQYTLFNPQAAMAVWQDAVDTAEELQKVAGSLRYCTKPVLKNLGYRPMFFLRHDYVMLFRVEESTVYVEAVYHQLQDYENSFSREL